MNCNNCGEGRPQVVPVLITDECIGCYARTNCVLVDGEYEYLELPEGAKLKTLLDALVAKVQELESRLS